MQSANEQSPATEPKRPRRTRAELRQLMLRAGKETIFEIEASMGFQELTYARVFAHLDEHYGQRVTIGSVHERIWESQRAFQLDVVGELLDEAQATMVSSAADRVHQFLESAPLDTPARRRDALRELVRRQSYHLGDEHDHPLVRLANTVRFRLWSAGTDHPEAADLLEPLVQMRTASTQQYVDIVTTCIETIGLRVRADAGDPDQAITSVALIGNAATLGLQTEVLDDASRPRRLPTGPGGELQDWYADSIAIWAMVQSVFELDGGELSDNERRL